MDLTFLLYTYPVLMQIIYQQLQNASIDKIYILNPE